MANYIIPATSRVWILGASDVEMSMIEQILNSVGERAFYGSVKSAQCHGGNAYRLDGIMPSDVTWGYPEEVVLVECGIIAGSDILYTPPVPEYAQQSMPIPTVICDHHRPGDPGFCRPAAEYLEASSIGQVLAVLKARGIDVSVTEEIRLTAAADHCLAEAYAGHCPGVYPATLERFRIQQKAHFECRSPTDVARDIESTRSFLRGKYRAIPAVEPTTHEGLDAAIASRTVHIEYVDGSYPHPASIVDLRNEPLVPELPEAACIERLAYLATVREPGSRRKVVLGGATTPEMVRDFLSGRIVAGLVDVYGDPARGFAGGYINTGGKHV